MARLCVKLDNGPLHTVSDAARRIGTTEEARKEMLCRLLDVLQQKLYPGEVAHILGLPQHCVVYRREDLDAEMAMDNELAALAAGHDGYGKG